jgi:hypothetical protein
MDTVENSFFSFFNKLFLIVCVIVTLSFTVYCTHQYLKNEDVSVVKFEEYHKDKDDGYPAVTMCFSHYFRYDDELKNMGALKKAFDEFKDLVKVRSFNSGTEGSGMNRCNTQITLYDSYTKFLSGKSLYNEKCLRDNQRFEEAAIKLSREFSKVSHENMVINITEYLLLALVETDPKDVGEDFKYDNHGKIKSQNWIPKHYLSGSNPERQCWTFEMPILTDRKKIVRFGLIFNGTIFKDPANLGVRPAAKGFEVKLSYPKQESKAKVSKINWIEDKGANGEGAAYTMKFDVQNMIVQKKRNKHEKKCIDNWKEYDEWNFKRKIKILGCQPSHWILHNTKTILPNCVDAKDLKKAYELTLGKHATDPCQMVEKMAYSYHELDGMANNNEYVEETDKVNENLFQVMIEFQGETFMKITQTRDYDLQSLVGNAGGYIGLFLGVALIQLPAFLIRTFCLTVRLFGLAQ